MKSRVLFSICFFIWASSQAQLINIESHRVQSDSLRQTTQMETLYNYQKNNGPLKKMVVILTMCPGQPLLPELSLNLPIISFDVPTNRFTTENKTMFFK